MAYFTYVIYSEKFNKIYIGYTHNIEERLIDHNLRARKGYTIRFRPWNLVFSEEHADKTIAMKREKELKSHQGRQSIWKKVEKYLEENK